MIVAQIIQFNRVKSLDIAVLLESRGAILELFGLTKGWNLMGAMEDCPLWKLKGWGIKLLAKAFKSFSVKSLNSMLQYLM